MSKGSYLTVENAKLGEETKSVQLCKGNFHKWHDSSEGSVCSWSMLPGLEQLIQVTV